MNGQKQHIHRGRFEPDVIIHEVVNRAEAVRIFLLGLFIGCVLGIFLAAPAHGAGMTAPNTYIPSNVTITGGSINGVTSGTFDKRYAFSGADGLGTNKKTISGSYNMVASDSGLFLDISNAPANSIIGTPTSFPLGFYVYISGPNASGVTIKNNAPNPFLTQDNAYIASGASFAVPANSSAVFTLREFSGGYASLSTTGRTIVANAVNNNEAVALGQFAAPPAIGNTTPAAITGTTVTAARYNLGNVMVFSSTAPTLGTGWGTSPTITNINGTAAFLINVGTGGTSTGGNITFPVTPNKWNCAITSYGTATTGTTTIEQAATTTIVALQNVSVTTNTTSPWAAGQQLMLICAGT